MVVIVPHVPLVPRTPPSREAAEMGTKIADLVRLMQKENPRIRPQDLRDAFRIAQEDLRDEIGGGGAQRRRILIMVALLVGLLVLGAFVAVSQDQGTAAPTTWLMVSVGVMVVVLAGIAVTRR